jgi:hypothetical protein
MAFSGLEPAASRAIWLVVDGLDLAALALAQTTTASTSLASAAAAGGGRGGGGFGGQGQAGAASRQGAQGGAQHQVSFHDDPHAGAQGERRRLGSCGNSGRRQRADGSVSAFRRNRD